MLTRAFAVALLLASGAAAPAAAQAPFTAPVDGRVVPIGFDGDGVITLSGSGLQRVTPAGATTLAADTEDVFLGAAATSERLVVQRATVDDLLDTAPSVAGFGPTRPGETSIGVAAETPRSRIELGPLTGPAATVADCPALDAVPVAPVATGATAAWRACGGSGVEVDDAGRRVSLRADGTVVALDVEGRRVAWLASRGAKRGALLQVADVDSGRITTTEGLRAVDPTVPAAVALAADGAARAVLTRPETAGTSVRNAPCTLETVSPTGTLGAPTRLRPCVAAQPIADANARLRPTAGARGATLELSADGASFTPVTTGPPVQLPSLVHDGDRYAATGVTCTESVLTAGTLSGGPSSAGVGSCPATVTGRRARVGRDGRLRVRVRCPAGCVLAARSDDVAFVRGGRAWPIGRGGLDVPAEGGTATLSLRAPGNLRRRLAGRTLTGRIVLQTLAGGRDTRAVRLVGPPER